MSTAPTAAPVATSAPAPTTPAPTTSAPDSSAPKLPEGAAGDLKVQVQEAVADGATPKEIQKMVEKFKLTVFGKEIERELDWNDKEGIKKELQMAAAARQVLQQGAEKDKKYGQFQDKLKNSPWEALAEMGHDPMELVEAKVQEILKDLEKTPEQKEVEKRQTEHEKLMKERDEAVKRAEDIEMDNLVNKNIQTLNTQIIDSLSKTEFLPKTVGTVRRIAGMLSDLRERGHEQVTPDDVVPYLEKQYQEEINEHLNSLSEAALEKYLDKSIPEKLRKGRVQKNTAPTKNVIDTGKDKPTVEEVRPKVSVREMLKQARNS